MITGSQIRIARHALRWSAEELSSKVEIASKTVRRIEASDGVPNSTAQTLMSIQTSLESAGIEFIGTPDDGPGIRIYSAPSKT